MISKDDSYVNYLKEKISSYINFRSIYDLPDTAIEDVFLFNDEIVYQSIFFSKTYITKCLTNIFKMNINYDILYNCNKYFLNLPIKVGKFTPITVFLSYLYEDAIEDSEYYIKKYIEDEELTVLRLLKTTHTEVFVDTPIWEVIKDSKKLAKGTKIYIKTTKDQVKIHLDAYNNFDSYNIITSAVFTTSIKVLICQPKVLKDGFNMHFAEKEISIRHFQLFEIFKKLLNEKIGSYEMLSALKEK